jgi:hypothetical protein
MVGKYSSQGNRLRNQCRRLWVRASFWGKASTVIVVLCALSILFSTSWTWQQQKPSVPEAQPSSKAAHITRQRIPPAPDVRDLSQQQTFLVQDPDAEEEADNNVYEATACFTEKCDGSSEDDNANATTIMIGILSDPLADVAFRAAARSTWLQAARELDSVEAVFFFPAATDDLEREASEHKDVVFGSRRTLDMPLAFQMFEFMADNASARHILRVNVRSYVVISRLLARLEQLCAKPACAGEDIWAGRQIASREIPAEDRAYAKDTGLTMYLPYMSSGAYLLSTSLASSLSLMHKEIGLKQLGAEDVSLGVWLIPMAARRVDLGSSVHLESDCCFDSAGKMTFDICARSAEQLPVVLSTLERPEYLHQYHDALHACP